jgi:malonate-semialdehyde dehydrogenase (acetylating) / methylmalonate-semialdehyde dehydrogenase
MKLNVGDGAEAGVQMGPLVTSEQQKRVAGYVEKGVAEGATPLVDGRERKPHEGGYFLGPTIFDHVTPEMTIAREEVFGPVLSVMRVETARRSHRVGQPLAVRQRDRDFHE